MIQDPCERRRALPRSAGLLSLWLLVVCGLPPAALAQAPAFLVKDINAQPVTASSNPRGFTTVGSTTFFVADTDTGSGLWTTDGTEPGTVQVKNFGLGPEGRGISVYPVTGVNGTLLFVAWDDSSGDELWKSDGTEGGTVRLVDINPGPGSSSPHDFTEVGGTLFFLAMSATGSGQLWKTDGTGRGTRQVADLGFASPLGLVDLDGTLFVVAGGQLWKSDGTTRGTMLVSAAPMSISSLTVTNGMLLMLAYAGSGYDLWKSDGTSAGTVLLKSNLLWNSYPVNVNGTLFFVAWDERVGLELWASDGTPAGTRMVNDIHSGPDGSDLAALTAVDGELFFVVQNGATGVELWKSDGTSTGTMLVKSLSSSGAYVQLIALDGMLFFVTESTSGAALWRSDGTPGGTIQLASPPGYVDYTFDALFTEVAGRLFFALRNQLWTSDGTPAGTMPLATISRSVPFPLAGAQGQLLFAGGDARTGVELWKSDGTPAGTMLLANLAPDTSTDTYGSDPSSLTAVGGQLFFLADDGVHGVELWRSDGMAAGTALVKDINPGSGSAFRYQGGSLTPVGDTLFFVADDGISGGELWRSDGTEPGTVRLTYINPAPYGPMPSALTAMGGRLFFLSGPALWTSDGTERGTVKVADVSALDGSSPFSLTATSDMLLFQRGMELWKSDGSAAGTTRVVDLDGHPPALMPVQSTVFFFIDQDLWKSDLTAGGTALVATVGEGYCRPNPDHFAVANQMLFFLTYRCDETTHPLGLWRSDGTRAGTERVTSLSGYASDLYLAPFDGALFFAETWGSGLSRTDGSATGTMLVKDLRPQSPLVDAGGSLLLRACAASGDDCGIWESDGTTAGTRRLAEVPVNFGDPSVTIAGSFAFFSAVSESTGDELWALPLASLGRCGNGALDPGEVCDTPGGSATCEVDCRVPTCGDGIVNHAAGEECDDGNTQNGDCCSATCTFEPSGSACGDGSACNGEETCDGAGTCQPGIPLPAGTACGDGNMCAGDAACDGSGSCQFGPPLACDDGNPYTTDWCDPSSGCLHARIPGPIGDCNGDGVVSVNELVAMVTDALGESPVLICPAGDGNLNQRITVDEIVAATNNALNAPCDLCDDP